MSFSARMMDHVINNRRSSCVRRHTVYTSMWEDSGRTAMCYKPRLESDKSSLSDRVGLVHFRLCLQFVHRIFDIKYRI